MTDIRVGQRSVRGPSYPTISLEDAISRATQFWTFEKRNAAPVEAAASHWGYSKTSSSWKSVLSALLQYGLLEEQGGSRDARMVKLTERALDIILDDPNSPKRLSAIQEAAKSPKIYSEILAKWPPSEPPSDSSLRYFLLREKGFNDASIAGFIRDFHSMLRLADFEQSGSLPPLDQVSTSINPSLGMISEEVDSPVTLHYPASSVASVGGVAVAAAIGFKQDIFSLDEGDVVLRYPAKMSQASYEDFNDWVELQLRKIKRSIQ